MISLGPIKISIINSQINTCLDWTSATQLTSFRGVKLLFFLFVGLLVGRISVLLSRYSRSLLDLLTHALASPSRVGSLYRYCVFPSLSFFSQDLIFYNAVEHTSTVSEFLLFDEKYKAQIINNPNQIK